MAEGSKGSEDETPKPTPKKDTKDVIRPNGTIKLKRPAPKHNKPGNWRDGSVVDGDEKKTRVANTESPSNSSITSPGPVVTQLDDTARETFATGRPLEDSPEVTQCKNCKKSILKSSIKAHLEACLANKREAQRKKKELKEAKEKAKKKDEADKDKKEEKAKAKDKKVAVDEDGDSKMGNDDEDEDAEGEDAPEVQKKPAPGGLKSAKKSAGKKTSAAADGEKKGKKRKADDGAEKGPKQKKKKEEPKPKAAKPKGPVDVERQCGVITPSGVPCARSLTCKSHSMGAKRAVPGRSLPYDMLLAAYQKKNQAKQQKAAIDANAPLEDEDEANAGPVDSDEETAAVMSALSHWRPQPLIAPPVLMPMKRKYQLVRLREQLDNATSGGTVNIFKVVSKNGKPLETDDEDAPGEPDYGIGGVQPVRRTSAILPNTQSQAQRKQSTASTK